MDMKWYWNCIGIPYSSHSSTETFRCKSASWMYMSWLAAQKEYAFMKVRHVAYTYLRGRLNVSPFGRFYMSITFQSCGQLTRPDTYSDGVCWCLPSVGENSWSMHVLHSWNRVIKASDWPGAFSWKTLLPTNGSHHPVHPCGTHTQQLQWIQHPHSPQWWTRPLSFISNTTWAPSGSTAQT